MLPKIAVTAAAVWRPIQTLPLSLPPLLCPAMVCVYTCTHTHTSVNSYLSGSNRHYTKAIVSVKGEDVRGSECSDNSLVSV